MKKYYMLAYKEKNKNTRWNVPTAHVFDNQESTHSNCLRVKRDDTRYIYVDHMPINKTVVICEHCVYGRNSLRSALYNENVGE